jgi:proline iminopeptidase
MIVRALALAGAAVGIASLASGCSQPTSSASPVAVDTGYVAVPGARLFYKSVGRGNPPILVVHGGPGMDHAYLLPGMLGLARSNRVVFYDQRGSGRSEGEVTAATVSFDRFMLDIDAIRDSLHLDRMVVLGHSWGGLLALRYAAKQPSGLHSLILMNTVEPGRRYTAQTTRMLSERRTHEDSMEIARIAQLPGWRERDTSVVNPLFRVMFRPTFSDRALAGRLAINLDARTARNMPMVATLVMGQFASSDFWPEAAKIRVPTLIVQGADDVMPIAMLRDLAKAIPAAELSVIDHAGHFPYIEKPDQTFAAIRSFLARKAVPTPEKVPFTIQKRP